MSKMISDRHFGCQKYEGGRMNNPNFVNLTGQKYGRLTVLERAENDKQGNAQWLCQCICGNKKVIRGKALRTGRTSSCGCLLSESSKRRMTSLMTKHGMAGSKLYSVYCSMRERCEKPSCPEYYRYGGRGISVCNEWKEDRSLFFEWAFKNGYKEGLQIDRKNNDGDYSPENCRWVTRIENLNNTSRNVFLEYNGETHTLAEWSRLLGINRSTIYNRRRLGKTPDEILKK